VALSTECDCGPRGVMTTEEHLHLLLVSNDWLPNILLLDSIHSYRFILHSSYRFIIQSPTAMSQAQHLQDCRCHSESSHSRKRTLTSQRGPRQFVQSSPDPQRSRIVQAARPPSELPQQRCAVRNVHLSLFVSFVAYVPSLSWRMLVFPKESEKKETVSYLRLSVALRFDDLGAGLALRLDLQCPCATMSGSLCLPRLCRRYGTLGQRPHEAVVLWFGRDDVD
jgi:hypothetical protein